MTTDDDRRGHLLRGEGGSHTETVTVKVIDHLGTAAVAVIVETAVPDEVVLALVKKVAKLCWKDSLLI